MTLRQRLGTYLAGMRQGSLVLWCYLIWYLIVLVRYFDPSPSLWFTSVGLSGIIGFGLLMSTTRTGRSKVKLERWQVIRLFLMPFCVSSFAALVRGRGFILVFSPHWEELAAAAALCTMFCATVLAVKRAAASNIVRSGMDSGQP